MMLAEASSACCCPITPCDEWALQCAVPQFLTVRMKMTQTFDMNGTGFFSGLQGTISRAVIDLVAPMRFDNFSGIFPRYYGDWQSRLRYSYSRTGSDFGYDFNGNLALVNPYSVEYGGSTKPHDPFDDPANAGQAAVATLRCTNSGWRFDAVAGSLGAIGQNNPLPVIGSGRFQYTFNQTGTSVQGSSVMNYLSAAFDGTGVQSVQTGVPRCFGDKLLWPTQSQIQSQPFPPIPTTVAGSQNFGFTTAGRPSANPVFGQCYTAPPSFTWAGFYYGSNGCGFGSHGGQAHTAFLLNWYPLAFVGGTGGGYVLRSLSSRSGVNGVDTTVIYEAGSGSNRIQQIWTQSILFRIQP